MKIGFFSDTYCPQINGVSTVLLTLERVFGRMGHQVYLFVPAYQGRRSGANGNTYRFPALPVLYRKESRLAWPRSREARRAFAQLDVVHSHTPFSLGLLAIRVAHKYGLPHVHTYHTLFTDYLHFLPRPLRPTQRMTERISATFCNRCDAVTTPSRPMRQELLSYGIIRPIYALPFGLDMSDFSRPVTHDLHAELQLPPDEQVLICAGRLSQEKNISFVLRAFKLMLARQVKLRLVIAGDGPARAQLEEEARALDLTGWTVFTGYLERNKLIDYYKAADLFVYGSKTETQGIVYSEALASGTPVVAVGEMGVLDVVEDGTTGLLLPEDEKLFAEATVELLHDRERLEEMGRAAIQSAHKESAERSCEQLLEIYRGLPVP